MNIQEAKFILGACRPDGSDAADPAFVEALALAERDPELRTWLERQRRFDRVVAEKVQAIQPPAGLREAILAGGRASRPRRAWWVSPVTLAAAAAVVVLAVTSYSLRLAPGRPEAAAMVAFALNDLMARHDMHDGYPAGLEGVQAQFSNAPLPLTSGMRVDLDELRRQKCRSVTIAGREVFEICFRREGTWYHLYAARRADFAPGELDPRALLKTSGEYAATAWEDAKNIYALVVHDGPAVLKRLI